MSNISNPRAETLYGFPQPTQKQNPPPIIAKRAPTVNDTGHPLGQLWVDKLNGNSYILGNVATGQAQWDGAAGNVSLDQLNGDSGSATPTAGAITIAGGTNLTSSAAGSTVTLNLDATVSGLTALTATTVSGTTINTNVGTAQLQLNGTTLSAVGTNPAISINIQPKSANLNLDSGNFNVNNGSMTATNNNVAGGQIFVVSNNFSDPNATARFVAQVNSSSGADVFNQWIIGGTKTYTMGIDASTTNDDFVLAASTALGTTNFLSFDGSTGNASFSGRIILTGTANVLSGGGDPNAAVTAPVGSLFLRTDGSSTSTRAYINTDGATAWTSITTAS